MKKFSKLINQLKGMNKTVIRYPITEIFLVIGAIVNAMAINGPNDYEKELLSLIVGAFIGVCAQALYERFFDKAAIRFGLMALTGVLTLGYYLLLLKAPVLSVEIIVRTTVALLALLFAFILIPIIKSAINFNQSFLSVFKSFFQTLLYSLVIFGGSSLIIFAFDTLIAPVDEKAFGHVANVVFVLFAPLFFLSLVPVYPGKISDQLDQQEQQSQNELIAKTTTMPRFLEILISYIIIPLAAVYTLILVLYLFLNVRGEFWSNNLMEPMLVSYSITVILIYLLASSINNKFANLFRLIFPKVLVPLVVFQIVASVLKIGDMGITYTRYYVIIYGVFAALAGIVMILLPPVKNSLIGAFLIAFSIVSIVPPVDAFTISKRSQINLLETTLIENGMLVDGRIVAKSDAGNEVKELVTRTVEYLSMMNYIGNIEFFPDDFNMWEDFNDTFGFNYYDIPDYQSDYVDIQVDQTLVISLQGYDYLAFAMLAYEKGGDTLPVVIDHNDSSYTLDINNIGGHDTLVLVDEEKQILNKIDLVAIGEGFHQYQQSFIRLTTQEATFVSKEGNIELQLLIRGGMYDFGSSDLIYYIDGYILIDFID